MTTTNEMYFPSRITYRVLDPMELASRCHSHRSTSFEPSNKRWNAPGADKLGGTGATTNDYNGPFDLAERVDATLRLKSINEETAFAGRLVTEAFRFGFEHPSVDYGYALRLTDASGLGARFHRSESGLHQHGPVLEITTDEFKTAR
ncbi:MAG: hypothetical protein L0Z50_36245 [Verrucomicrobiales bacterium]|nr:hypothetical protein [Verrucomicrobiales bacterium]